MTLFPISDYLNHITESFAALLDLEFTIINADPIQRVTGTGYYRSEKHQDVRWDTSYTNKVVQSRKPIVALDTSAYRARDDVNARLAGNEYYSLILHPIYFREEVVGVIVIASFNERQQSQLLKKQSRLMEYLTCISELISLKLAQDEAQEIVETERGELELIYENISNGIILFSDGRVARMNTMAHQLLQQDCIETYELYLDDVRGLAALAGETGEDQRKEFYHTCEGKSRILTAKAIPLKDGSRNVIVLLLPFVQVQEDILQSSSAEIPEGEMIAVSDKMTRLISSVKMVAMNDSNVLVTGESGTGKELVARLIHARSRRADKPFVSINCAAIPESLLESELFGYEGGAFTGASRGGKIGKFMLADKGTLFLDEIGDMPLYLQAKLLRAISERKIDRIGGERPVAVDVRIIAATNRNLEQMMREKTFREDLYYRLSVIPFAIPPLRERPEDIIPLARHFIGNYNRKVQKSVRGISNEVAAIFLSYDWPGNVRELENAVEYMMNFEQNPILSAATLPPRLREKKGAEAPEPGMPVDGGGTLKERVARFEAGVFRDFLEAHDGKPSVPEIRAFCDELKISTATYYRKQAEYQKG